MSVAAHKTLPPNRASAQQYRAAALKAEAPTAMLLRFLGPGPRNPRRMRRASLATGPHDLLHVQPTHPPSPRGIYAKSGKGVDPTEGSDGQTPPPSPPNLRNMVRSLADAPA